MREVFVIYNKTTGRIDGGAGRVDRERDAKIADGSTMTERIAAILAKNSNRRVTYLPNQPLPDPQRHKIENGQIIELTQSELEADQLKENRVQLVNREVRRMAIQNLIDKEELPLDYVEG